jgi:hypothetical protein
MVAPAADPTVDVRPRSGAFVPGADQGLGLRAQNQTEFDALGAAVSPEP